MFKRQNQLPSNDKVKMSNVVANSADKRLNGLYRSLRILEAEVLKQKNELSILKRDVARIDRKQYREAAVPITTPEQPNPSASDFDKQLQLLYGGGK